jgi:hypothetical protein
MGCKSIKNEDFAERYLHNRLNETEMDKFETHLLECANCRREFELLQAAQAELAERAHEIRTWTPAKPFFLRWQTMSAAALVVVVVAGAVAGAFFFRGKKAGQALTAEHTPSSAGLANPSPPEKPTQATAGVGTVGNPSNTAKVLRDVSPHINAGPIPPSTVGAARTDRSNEDVTAVSNSAGEKDKSPGEAAYAEPSTPVPTKETKNKEFPMLTAEQGVEAFRLGAVEAAPFSFAGIGHRAVDPKGGKTNTYDGKGGPADTGRKLFSDGMNEYVQGRYREATSFLLSALRFEPVAPDTNFYLGVCRILDGHPEESVAPLQSAIAAGATLYLEPAHYYLGKAYVQQLKLKEAEFQFQEAAKIPGPFSTDSKALLPKVTALREQIGQD